MSGTNAIHGIVAARRPRADRRRPTGFLTELLLVIAIVFGTINVVGGFLVTDRMLEMFKGKKRDDGAGAAGTAWTSDFINAAYIVAFIAVHHRAGAAHEPDDGGPRQPHRRGRHGGRGRSRRCCATDAGDWGLIAHRRS